MLDNIKGRVRFNEPLKKHTSFRIGGPAEFFIEPKDLTDLKSVLKSLKKNKIPFLVIGSGSNILACDTGLEGVVVKLSSSFFKKIMVKGNYLEVASGVLLKELLNFAHQKALSGLEFLAGIPGTAGGALMMNAGAQGKNIGNLVAQVKVIDYNNHIRVLKPGDIKFSYRKSSLSKYVILSIKFRLVKGKRSCIRKEIGGYLDYRKKMQDYGYPSAGCVFKNPDGYSAGRLIDLCGLKGRKVGPACISNRHANFILNRGRAKASDILKLMSLAQDKVYRKFRIKLEPEIKIWNSGLRIKD